MPPLFPPLRPKHGAALRDVDSRDARARAAAAEALGQPPAGHEDEAKEALRPLADDPVAGVRAAAIASLGHLADADALDLVLARFEDGDPTVRQVALIAAAEIGDARAGPALRRALSSPHPEVRFQAVASVALLAPDGAVEDLAALADDPDPLVRAHLADALGALEDPRAADALAPMLEDEATEVRRAAGIALGRIGDRRAVAALVETLDDKERCFEAAWALGELGAREAVEPLARVAAAFLKPLAVKAAAGAALVRLGDPRGVPALRGVLTALRSDARSYAVQLVGELELEALASEVAKLAARPRGADPVVVARALRRLAPTSAAAAEALARMEAREDEAGEVARGAVS
ncbi:MAG TPA: HEAT repeat domain-containing protein [Sandaracinaceae bacterium LLY-WYZ-13_1]|nr:HEAT repeat domain-containing protein [Sandaracinaceae bacterium LLY-WYZ-13_1]